MSAVALSRLPQERPAMITISLRISTALLITFAIAIIMIEASVRFGKPLDNFDLLFAITPGG
jgi:hypothetical protein